MNKKKVGVKVKVERGIEEEKDEVIEQEVLTAEVRVEAEGEGQEGVAKKLRVKEKVCQSG